ncbi:MAG: putative glycoside hydrolase [bacterium]|nr:putative glycoside hydrolase [bacterium]
MTRMVASALLAIFLLAPTTVSGESPKIKPPPDKVRAIYLGSPNLFNEKKIAELEKIIADGSTGSPQGANGIVIDFKDSNLPPYERLARLAKRFKNQGAYTIARVVTFQDSYFARRHPEIAIKHSDGSLWHSGRKEWKRYWLDPASPLAQNYNIEIAKKAADCGFDEIQFDYIRFPTDGNMQDIRYPIFNPQEQSKAEVMKGFFQKIRRELKSYAPDILISIDVFGEVFAYGKEAGIGQILADVTEYFDVICPMAYPSHYKCGAFGLKDPTTDPYKVYYETLKRGLTRLDGKSVIIRPWIQDFTIQNIYGCGPTVVYTKEKVLAQIRAGRDLGISGFMLWNASNNFTAEVFKE